MTDVFGTPTNSNLAAISSPTSRRLSIGTPCLAQKDDAREIRERRKSKLFELQNKHLSSPLTPNKSSPRNTSNNPLKGLSTTQLSDHYANCVKLNAENKINVKNAFGLHLIDYMTDLLKGKKLGDFQVAGTTLDASAKIYASRVDAIHSETYKVLSTLSRGNKKKDKEGDNEDNDGDISGAENDDEGVSNNKVKKTKKIQRNKFIEKNLKNINLDTFELEYEMDPLFKSLTTAFAEGLSSGLLLSALSCYTDSSELVLDSTTIIEDIENQPLSKTNKDPIGMSKVTDFLEKNNFYKSEICPSFSNFKFNNWNEADETHQTSDKLNSDYNFDLDAEAREIPDDDDDEDYHCDDEGIFDDGGGEDDEIVGIVDNNADNAQKANVVSITDNDQLLKTTLSTISNAQSMVDFLASAPSEYSFFNKKLLQTWKGPAHWKIHPMARASANSTNKPSQGKAAVKKIKFLLNFDQEKDFVSDFKKARNCVFTKKRLEDLKVTSFLLPKLLNYQSQALFGCFWKPSIMVRRQATSATVDDDLVVGYDYDNDNDKQNFCPDYNRDYDDNSEDLFGFSCATSNASQQSDITSLEENDDPNKLATLIGDDLVALPQKVAKINISYAKTAKKVDVRRLKQSMWKMMTQTTQEENKENQDQNVEQSKEESSEETTVMKTAVLFSDLVKHLPEKVPSFMAKNISVPIAFVCMLHLANEKCLSLNALGFTDIEISQLQISA